MNRLRKITKMKPFLNKSQMKILTQALVISSLDYCNALYYGIDSQLMKQLQVIQNRACRVIFGLKRRDSVDSFIKELHWLKVEQRIQFKILLLAYISASTDLHLHTWQTFCNTVTLALAVAEILH